MTDAHVGGAVPISSEAYADRPFEREMREQLLANRWVLLLGPRQHGKTSALVRLVSALRAAGLACAYVDLQGAPPCATFPEYLDWVGGRVARSLNRTRTPAPGARDDELADALYGAVGSGGAPIAIVFDEAAAVPEQWRNMFFGQLRVLANEAAMSERDSIAARLRCVFAGTFRPETLVDDLNSPFNVCQKILTDDLTEEDVTRLWRLVVVDDDELARHVYAVVGGQPYLVQRLMSAVVSGEGPRAELLQQALADLRKGEDDHFEGVFSRVLAEPNLAAAVGTMVASGNVALAPANPDAKYLQTLGLARRVGRELVFRNEIYREFATGNPQFSLSAAVIETAQPTRLVAMPSSSFEVVSDLRLREFAVVSMSAAIGAYNAGAYRPSLVQFGAATEALLIDFLTAHVDGQDLSNTVNRLRQQLNWQNGEDRARPATWRLVNLIKVCRGLGGTMARIVDPPDALREWRNLVHPGLVLTRYRPSGELEPEARAASGLVAAIVRDLATV